MACSCNQSLWIIPTAAVSEHVFDRTASRYGCTRSRPTRTTRRHRCGHPTRHGLSSNKMGLITSDCDAMRTHSHQMALITSECVPAACVVGSHALLSHGRKVRIRDCRPRGPQTAGADCPPKTMALITSDCGTTRLPGHRMARITSGCALFRCGCIGAASTCWTSRTPAHRSPFRCGHGLQLQSLWRIPTAAVS